MYQDRYWHEREFETVETLSPLSGYSVSGYSVSGYSGVGHRTAFETVRAHLVQDDLGQVGQCVELVVSPISRHDVEHTQRPYGVPFRGEDVPHYRFNLAGQDPFTLTGKDQVGMLYGHWTATDQCVFYVSDEQVAVGDHMVIGRGIGYQQTLGSELAAAGLDVDPEAMYLKKSQIMMLWPYDDQCRLLGEDVWEFDTAEAGLFKLNPADVLTVEQSRELLDPYIKRLPPFDDSMLPR